MGTITVAAIAADDYRMRDFDNLEAAEDEVAEAIATAKETCMKVSNPTPINAGYVLTILKGVRKKNQASDPDEWWKTSETIDAKGMGLRLRAEVSASYHAFKTRILAELRKCKYIKHISGDRSNAS